MDDMKSGAEHVLAHGTARTRAAAGGEGRGGGGGEHKKAAAMADGKKKIRAVEVEKAHDGTYIMRHKHHPPFEKPEHDETATGPDLDAVKAHLEEQMGGGEAGGEEEAAAGGPNPQEEAAAAAGAGGGAPGGMPGA